MTSYREADQAVLDRYEPSWAAKGYRLVREPSPNQLPSFLKDYGPAAILFGKDVNVIVEILRKGQEDAGDKIQGIRERVKGQQNWRLEVIYAGQAIETLPEATDAAIRTAMESVRQMAPREPGSAVLLASSVLEALARRLESRKMQGGQTMAATIELLAGQGHVTPNEAQRLRDIARVGDAFAHGVLDRPPSRKDVDDLVGILEHLAAPSREEEPAD